MANMHHSLISHLIVFSFFTLSSLEHNIPSCPWPLYELCNLWTLPGFSQQPLRPLGHPNQYPRCLYCYLLLTTFHQLLPFVWHKPQGLWNNKKIYVDQYFVLSISSSVDLTFVLFITCSPKIKMNWIWFKSSPYHG